MATRIPYNMRPLAYDARYLSKRAPAAPAAPRTWRDLNKAQLRALLYFNDGNADLDDSTKAELVALAEFWIEEERAGGEGASPDFLDQMMRGEWNRSAHVPAMLAALAGGAK